MVFLAINRRGYVDFLAMHVDVASWVTSGVVEAFELEPL